MGRTWLLLMLPFLLGQSPPPKESAASEHAARNKRERLSQIYTNDAATLGQELSRDVSKSVALEDVTIAKSLDPQDRKSVV